MSDFNLNKKRQFFFKLVIENRDEDIENLLFFKGDLIINHTLEEDDIWEIQDLLSLEYDKGKNALCIAVEYKNVEMTKLLLKFGADPRLPMFIRDEWYNNLPDYLLKRFEYSIQSKSRMGYLYLAIVHHIELMNSPDKESELLPKIEDYFSKAM